jgi:hypothetical protein
VRPEIVWRKGGTDEEFSDRRRSIFFVAYEIAIKEKNWGFVLGIREQVGVWEA